MPAPLLVTFVGGRAGAWRVERMAAIAGDPLPFVPHVAVVEGAGAALPADGAWYLRGVTSHERYTDRRERDRLVAVQPSVGRPQATPGAPIPVSKPARSWG